MKRWVEAEIEAGESVMSMSWLFLNSLPPFLSPFLYPPDFPGDTEHLQYDGNKDF